MSGPGQDIPGSDGIGDTPYSVPGPGGHIDYYPLMEPWNNSITPINFNIELEPGWNLISLPLALQNNSLESVLSSIDGQWDRIMTYDPLSPEPWKSTCTYKPASMNEVDTIDHKLGFWLHCPNEDTFIYTLDGISSTSGDHKAWFLDVDNALDSEFKVPNSAVEFTDSQYLNASESNDIRAVSEAPGMFDEVFTKVSWLIDQNPAYIEHINMSIEIQAEQPTNFSIWAFNVALDQWQKIGIDQPASANSDVWITRTISANCSDFVSANSTIQWGCYQWDSNEAVKVDYLELLIKTGNPTIELSITGTVPESTQIQLYAGWNLVGYPSLNPEIVANALFGTAADRVEVCDPAEPYMIKEVGADYLMHAGEGYWVHVPADAVWVIDW